ncbi:stage 0 sporulation family protein [Candidatus Hydrogenedentota bacterium]
MITQVQFRLRKPCRIYTFLAENIDLKQGDFCIVQSDRGPEMGRVVAPPVSMPDAKIDKENQLRVIRCATDEDIARQAENREFEREAFEIGDRKITECKLAMKLVAVESTFDRSKMVFYFTAEGRIDFRELVKDLAFDFKTRIELRQIGVRDEARMTGGIGPCGRVLCCNSFLRKFSSVSIKMAKRQKLALNPTKISGLCGRLMCCIQYEDSMYQSGFKPCKARPAKMPVQEFISYPAIPDEDVSALEDSKTDTLPDGTVVALDTTEATKADAAKKPVGGPKSKDGVEESDHKKRRRRSGRRRNRRHGQPKKQEAAKQQNRPPSKQGKSSAKKHKPSGARQQAARQATPKQADGAPKTGSSRRRRRKRR